VVIDNATGNVVTVEPQQQQPRRNTHQEQAKRLADQAEKAGRSW
jgi:hypothetical protein